MVFCKGVSIVKPQMTEPCTLLNASFLYFLLLYLLEKLMFHFLACMVFTYGWYLDNALDCIMKGLEGKLLFAWVSLSNLSGKQGCR